MTITVLTDDHEYRFDAATDWSRDDAGNVYVYDGDETLASFNADRYVAVVPGFDRPSITADSRF
jgi:hypothetical protein